MDKQTQTLYGNSVVNADLEVSEMQIYDNDRLGNLREMLLTYPIYTDVVSIADLQRFMDDHVFTVWDFMSLPKRLQQDLTCTRVPGAQSCFLPR
jgi:hypothetical protein